MNKIKLFAESGTGRNILVVLVVLLVGIGSFGLGKTSKKTGEDSGVGVYSPDQNASAILEPLLDSAENSQQKTYAAATGSINTAKGSTDPSGMSYMASKIGHKYYPVDCSAGKGIKGENRIYFSTEAEAQAAGYTKSTSCK